VYFNNKIDVLDWIILIPCELIEDVSLYFISYDCNRKYSPTEQFDYKDNKLCYCKIPLIWNKICFCNKILYWSVFSVTLIIVIILTLHSSCTLNVIKIIYFINRFCFRLYNIHVLLYITKLLKYMFFGVLESAQV